MTSPTGADSSTARDRPHAGTGGRIGRMLGRLAQAALPWRYAIPGALIWAGLMATSATLNLVAAGWQSNDSIRNVALVFGIGGAVGFPLGLTAAALIARGRSSQAGFAAAFVGLVLATIGATSLIYALEYRIYYAQWHANAFTLTWAFQFVFTSLVSTAQFAVSGLPLYFPVGFIGVPVAALWFARQSR